MIRANRLARYTAPRAAHVEIRPRDMAPRLRPRGVHRGVRGSELLRRDQLAGRRVPLAPVGQERSGPALHGPADRAARRPAPGLRGPAPGDDAWRSSNQGPERGPVRLVVRAVEPVFNRPHRPGVLARVLLLLVRPGAIGLRGSSARLAPGDQPRAALTTGGMGVPAMPLRPARVARRGSVPGVRRRDHPRPSSLTDLRVPHVQRSNR